MLSTEELTLNSAGFGPPLGITADCEYEVGHDVSFGEVRLREEVAFRVEHDVYSGLAVESNDTEELPGASVDTTEYVLLE